MPVQCTQRCRPYAKLLNLPELWFPCMWPSSLRAVVRIWELRHTAGTAAGMGEVSWVGETTVTSVTMVLIILIIAVQTQAWKGTCVPWLSAQWVSHLPHSFPLLLENDLVRQMLLKKEKMSLTWWQLPAFGKGVELLTDDRLWSVSKTSPVVTKHYSLLSVNIFCGQCHMILQLQDDQLRM